MGAGHGAADFGSTGLRQRAYGGVKGFGTPVSHWDGGLAAAESTGESLDNRADWRHSLSQLCWIWCMCLKPIQNQCGWDTQAHWAAMTEQQGGDLGRVIPIFLWRDSSAGATGLTWLHGEGKAGKGNGWFESWQLHHAWRAVDVLTAWPRDKGQ